MYVCIYRKRERERHFSTHNCAEQKARLLHGRKNKSNFDMTNNGSKFNLNIMLATICCFLFLPLGVVPIKLPNNRKCT